MYFNQKSILAADYLRLSREDGDKLESDSIRNQRSLINDFIKQHKEIQLVEEYIDDGYSGTWRRRLKISVIPLGMLKS